MDLLNPNASTLTAPFCETKSPVWISREAMIDLDLFRLCRAFFPSEYPAEEDIEGFLQMYLTDDACEIQRRSEIISGLRANSEYKRLIASVIADWRRLSRSLSELARSPRALMAYTQTRHALRVYAASIENMEALFSFAGSPAVAGIAEGIRVHKNSPFYAQVQECLRRVDRLMKPLESVTLAINMTEAGQAMQIGVTDINLHPEKMTGLFGGARENVNSLCDAAPIRQRSEIIHLEEYIISQVERQMAQQLNAALRVMGKIDLRMLYEWQEWLRPIELYHIGLLLSEALQRAGYAECRPEPCADTLDADGMLYPHMVLSAHPPVPQTLRFTQGDAVMITGANNSGKTSSLKAFAQNCLLAQLGFWVPARSFRFIPFSRWATVFSAGEDDKMRASRYQQEAERMRGIIASAEPRTCVLLNEPFTSTNPTEAAELLSDIVMQLHQKGATLILVTHIFDIYDLLCGAGASFVRSYVTRSVLDAEGMTHTYALEEKAPDGLSYARLLAKEYGLDIGSLIHDRGAARVLEEYLAGGGHSA